MIEKNVIGWTLKSLAPITHVVLQWVVHIFGLKPGIVHLGRRILAISREKGHRLYPSAVPDDES